MTDRELARRAPRAEPETAAVEIGAAPEPLHLAGPDLTPSRVLALQRSAGNSAVTRLLQQTGATPAATLQRQEAPVAAAKDKLTQLKEKLSASDAPEEEIIELMGTLSATEVGTVLDSDDFKNLAVACFDDDEMDRAVRAMKGDRAKGAKWLEAEGVPKHKFVKTAKTELDGVKLDPALDKKVTELADHLLGHYMVTEDIMFDGIGGLRSLTRAHEISTAYHIQEGSVKLEALKALKDGKDQDGNLWYKEGWSDAEIKANAKGHWDGALAYEGYPVGDPRRLPNGLVEPKVSEHCSGKAMDLTIKWRDGNGWHQEANDLVAKYGLVRPIAKEHWHFELPAAAP